MTRAPAALARFLAQACTGLPRLGEVTLAFRRRG
jgi:hypothetical protein